MRKADSSEIKLTYSFGGKIEKRKIERENIFGVLFGGDF